MPDENSRQAIIDEEHLRLLALGYVISAWISVIFAFFGLLSMGIGMISMRGMAAMAGDLDIDLPQFIQWISITASLCIFLLMISLALIKFRVARYLKRRQSRVLCMIVAATCWIDTVGIILGVFTFIVLRRPSVKALFEPRSDS